MGTLGIPEMMFIFTLALLIFGPKKLPELGRTVGKALAEFRRAQGELKATFDREMRSLERESESLKEATNSYYQDSYNYDHSYDQSSYDSNPYNHESSDSTATDSKTEGASATQGAESTTTAMHLTGQPPEGTVASGSYNYETGSYDGYDYNYESSPVTTASNDPAPSTSASPDAPSSSETTAVEPKVKS